MSGDRLNFILQLAFNQLRRWRLNLPEELVRPNIAFKLGHMEGGVDLPTWGQTQLERDW